MKRLLTLFVAAAATVMVQAQAKLDSFDAHCADVVILQAKPVQTELKITEAQRAKMNQAAQWHSGELKKIDDQVKAKKIDPQKTNLQPRLAGLFGQLKQRVLVVLTPTQVKRLRELTLQRVGDSALCDPVVAKRIGMSDAQLKKMQATYSEGARKFAQTEQAAVQKVLLPYKDRKPKDQAEAQKLNQEVQAKMRTASQQIRPQLNRLRADYAKRIRAILTTPQFQAYSALRGKPFKA